jgi:hypothetical protein
MPHPLEPRTVIRVRARRSATSAPANRSATPGADEGQLCARRSVPAGHAKPQDRAADNARAVQGAPRILPAAVFAGQPECGRARRLGSPALTPGCRSRRKSWTSSVHGPARGTTDRSKTSPTWTSRAAIRPARPHRSLGSRSAWRRVPIFILYPRGLSNAGAGWERDAGCCGQLPLPRKLHHTAQKSTCPVLELDTAHAARFKSASALNVLPRALRAYAPLRRLHCESAVDRPDGHWSRGRQGRATQRATSSASEPVDPL